MRCHDCQRGCHSDRRKQPNFLLPLIRKKQTKKAQHQEKPVQLAIVGMPNVGKSVLFNALTRSYVTVSNYPGTTVEVSRGETFLGNQAVAIVDTPGMYSLFPISEEEKVARDLLFTESVDLALHVVDAKNLGRMLPLTFQLLEAGLPLWLVVNMLDEAQQLGLNLQRENLEAELGIPVIGIAAALGWGLKELKQRMTEYVCSSRLSRAG